MTLNHWASMQRHSLLCMCKHFHFWQCISFCISSLLSETMLLSQIQFFNLVHFYKDTNYCFDVYKKFVEFICHWKKFPSLVRISRHVLVSSQMLENCFHFKIFKKIKYSGGSFVMNSIRYYCTTFAN